MSPEERLFRCLACGREFSARTEEIPEKCPFCRSRFLILVKGAPLPKRGSCSSSG